LPPDVREWLPADHLAWFVIDAVGQMDLSGFYAAYPADGHGRAAYEPSMMVTLVLYACSTGVRSSRAIERHCRQDVAYRVVTGNVVPDHATIARFIARHERALAALFDQVLRLCDQAGEVKPGLIAIDGTRIAGNANSDRNGMTWLPYSSEDVQNVLAFRNMLGSGFAHSAQQVPQDGNPASARRVMGPYYPNVAQCSVSTFATGGVSGCFAASG
jgi:transposase